MRANMHVFVARWTKSPLYGGWQCVHVCRERTSLWQQILFDVKRKLSVNANEYMEKYTMLVKNFISRSRAKCAHTLDPLNTNTCMHACEWGHTILTSFYSYTFVYCSIIFLFQKNMKTVAWIETFCGLFGFFFCAHLTDKGFYLLARDSAFIIIINSGW